MEPGTDASTEPRAQSAAEPTLLEQMGGLSGLVASTLPVLVLIPINSMWGLGPALGAALAVGILVFIWRLVRKENLQPAISGLLGVGICAAIAWYVGSAKGYFLYGIWYSAVAGVLFVFSCLIRWPAVGVIWRGINGHSMVWRKNRAATWYFITATMAWAIIFGARFLVQWRLYNSDSTEALGIVRILMGWPLTIVVVLITVWAVRRADQHCEPQLRKPVAEPAITNNAEAE